MFDDERGCSEARDNGLSIRDGLEDNGAKEGDYESGQKNDVGGEGKGEEARN